MNIGQKACLFLRSKCLVHILQRGRRGRDRMVVGFIATYAINAYHQH